MRKDKLLTMDDKTQDDHEHHYVTDLTASLLADMSRNEVSTNLLSRFMTTGLFGKSRAGWGETLKVSAARIGFMGSNTRTFPQS